MKKQKLFTPVKWGNELNPVLWLVLLWIPFVGLVYGLIKLIFLEKSLFNNNGIYFIYGWYHFWAAPILLSALHHHIFVNPIPFFPN